MISVLIVEDHLVVRYAVRMALQAEGMTVEVAPLTSVEALLAVTRELRPDVVLLAIDLGATLGTGRDLIAPLREHAREVVMFTGATDWFRLSECIEQGASGFVIKSEAFDQLLVAVVDAAAGRSRLDPSQRSRLLADLARQRVAAQDRLGTFERLTGRERDVLASLMDGKHVEAIAAEDGVCEATIRSQVRGVLAKLGVGSQLAAVAAARQAGWNPSA